MVVSPWYVDRNRTLLAGFLSLFLLGPFSVAALLSFDNRWANGFCHLTPSISALLSCTNFKGTDTYTHTLKSEHNQLSDSLMGSHFWTLNKQQIHNLLSGCSAIYLYRGWDKDMQLPSVSWFKFHQVYFFEALRIISRSTHRLIKTTDLSTS